MRTGKRIKRAALLGLCGLPILTIWWIGRQEAGNLEEPQTFEQASAQTAKAARLQAAPSVTSAKPTPASEHDVTAVDEGLDSNISATGDEDPEIRRLRRPGAKFPELLQQERDGVLHTWVANQLLITLQNPAGLAVLEAEIGAYPELHIRWLNAETCVIRWDDPSPENFSAIKARMTARLGDMAAVENDGMVRAAAIPADPMYPQQDYFQQIAAEEAWAKGADGSGIVVAVLDSGTQLNHPDLSAAIAINAAEIAGNGRDDDGNDKVDDVLGWDFVDDDNHPDDVHGHGTAMAGAIGAIWNNSGIAGVANGVSILPVRFLDEDGFGTSSDHIAAIEYTLTRDVDIINASFGGPSSSIAVRNQYAKLNDRGIWVVAASGNDRVDTDRIANYPSSYDLPNIISVGAARRDDKLAGFSNFGASSVDLFAPGENVLSTAMGSSYETATGTSIATAISSGALALLLAEFPQATATDLRARFVSRSRYVAALDGKCSSSGILHIGHAIDAGDPRSPAVLNEAQDLAFEAGETVELKADYLAYGRPMFQWYRNDEPIEGVTGSSYSFLAFDETDEGSYSVEVRTTAGVDRRNVAVIRIHKRVPEIDSQPDRLSLAPEVPLSIHVKASGSKPLSYQWFRNDQRIEGATSDTYRVNAATESTLGTYTLEVRNRFGSITSKPIIVSFDPAFILDWRQIGQSQVSKVDSAFFKSGDFHWNTVADLQTRDFIEWMPMDSRISYQIPVYADGTYWTIDSNHQLMRSVDGIEWQDVSGIVFERPPELAAGNGVLLAFEGEIINSSGYPVHRYKRITTDTLNVTDRTLEGGTLLFDGTHFWAQNGETQLRSSDGLTWSNVNLGGRLLVHIDNHSGVYVAWSLVNYQTVYEYSNDLSNWQTLPSNYVIKYGEGTATIGRTTLVFATGEIRDFGPFPWRRLHYEGTRLRLMSLNGIPTRVDIETGEVTEILHKELEDGPFHIVGDAVYVFADQGLSLWDPAAGYLKVSGEPAGDRLITDPPMAANGYAFFTTQNRALYRIREGERQLELLSSAPSAVSFSAHQGSNLVQSFNPDQRQWSIDGESWRPGPDNVRLMHLNGTVLNVPNLDRQTPFEAKVLRWNEAAYDWEQAARLPLLEGHSQHTLLGAGANSSHFCVVIGTRAFFSTDGSEWFPYDLPPNRLRYFHVYDDQFVFETEQGIGHVTRDGTSWSQADPDRMAHVRTSWLSVDRFSQIARAEGSRFPIAPVVAISGGRIKSAPASWEITASADVPAAHLYSELWINGRFAGRQTGSNPRFNVEQLLPGFLKGEVRSHYTGGLVLRSMPFQLSASADAQSDLQTPFRSENGNHRALPPPGADFYRINDALLAFAIVDKTMMRSRDGNEWTQLPAMTISTPAIFPPTEFADGSLLIPLNRPFFWPGVTTVANFIPAGQSSTIEVPYPREQRVDADFLSINNRAFMLFVDGALYEFTSAGEWLEHPPLELPRPDDGTFQSPQRHYRIHHHNGLVLFEMFFDNLYFAMEVLYSVHQLAVPAGWTHHRNLRFQTGDGIHSSWLIGADNRFTEPLAMPYYDATWTAINSDTYSTLADNLLWVATRDGRAYPVDAGLSWISTNYGEAVFSLYQMDGRLLVASNSGQMRSIIQHDFFPTLLAFSHTEYGSENSLHAYFHLHSGGLFDLPDGSTIEVEVFLHGSGTPPQGRSLGTFAIDASGLRPFHPERIELNIPMPADIRLGEFALSVQLDPNNSFEELSEANNLTASDPFIYNRDVPLLLEVVGDGWLESNTADSAVPFGRTVSFDAMPAAGSGFVGWSGSLQGKMRFVDLTADQPVRMRAHFIPMPILAVFPDLEPQDGLLRYSEPYSPQISPAAPNWAHLDHQRWAFFPDRNPQTPAGTFLDLEHGWLFRMHGTPFYFSFDEQRWMRFD